MDKSARAAQAAQIVERFKERATKHGVTSLDHQNVMLLLSHCLMRLAGDAMNEAMPPDYLLKVNRPTAIASLLAQTAHLAADLAQVQNTELAGVDAFTPVRGEFIKPGTVLRSLMDLVGQRRGGTIIMPGGRG